VEEQARGDPEKAVEFRASVVEIIGDDLSRLQPGSEEAAALKRVLIEKGAWSQYLGPVRERSNRVIEWE
jgi:fumarylacetoacetate (FAA) hydrolase family protein